MIAYQMGLDGTMMRATSWKVILIEVIKRNKGLIDKLDRDPKRSIEKWNKFVIGTTLALLPDTTSLIAAIRNAPTDEVALKVFKSFWTKEDMPSMETLARGLRDSKTDLEKANQFDRHEPYKEKPDEIDSFDELLIMIDKSSIQRDSSLEHRFKVALDQHFPSHHFIYHDRLTDKAGNIYELDFLCRELGIAVEIDGFEYHNDLHSFVRDRQKNTALQLEGYTALMFSGNELSVNGGISRALDKIAEAIQKRNK